MDDAELQARALEIALEIADGNHAVDGAVERGVAAIAALAKKYATSQDAWSDL